MQEFKNEPDSQLKYENSADKARQNEAVLFVWEIIKIVLISLVIIIPIRYYVVQPFFVRGASMEPMFINGDYILIDEMTYRFRDPQRGEVIVFRSPEDRSQFFIKRIIGLPGETVQIKDNQIIIHNTQNPGGFFLNESGYLNPGVTTEGEILIKIDENEYFVMGDNRGSSSDSRRWGALNETLITGRILVRVWPFNKIEKF